MSTPDCSPISHPKHRGRGRFKACLGPDYFLLQLSDCILETCMLLAGVRVGTWALVTPVKAIYGFYKNGVTISTQVNRWSIEAILYFILPKSTVCHCNILPCRWIINRWRWFYDKSSANLLTLLRRKKFDFRDFKKWPCQGFNQFRQKIFCIEINFKSKRGK